MLCRFVLNSYITAYPNCNTFLFILLFEWLHIRAKPQTEERWGFSRSSWADPSAQQQQGCGPIKCRWVLRFISTSVSALSSIQYWLLCVSGTGAPSLMLLYLLFVSRVQSRRRHRASSRAQPQTEREEENDGPQQGRNKHTHTHTQEPIYIYILQKSETKLNFLMLCLYSHQCSSRGSIQRTTLIIVSGCLLQVNTTNAIHSKMVLLTDYHVQIIVKLIKQAVQL